MVEREIKGTLAAEMLDLYPPSIRQSVIGSKSFREKYGLTADARMTIGDNEINFKRSQFYTAARDLYKNNNAVISVFSDEGDTYSLSLEYDVSPPAVLVSSETRRIRLRPLWFLSPHVADRLEGFDTEAKQRHLVDPIILSWREKLAIAPLEDDEVDELYQELRLNPGEVANAIANEIPTGHSKTSVLVPNRAVYYDRLVGESREAADLQEFVETTAKERLSRLLSWDFVEGLKLALLMSPHSSIVAEIEISAVDEPVVIELFEWLERHGDRFSQVAGIELGLRLLERHGPIEPILFRMVRALLYDNPDDDGGRLALTASLAVFADGELSRIGIFRGKRPFWRRLAAIAQASIIERELLRANVPTGHFADWARTVRGQAFFLQTLTDLRLEPRWLPEFMSASQLRFEFLGRVVNAAATFRDAIRSDEFRSVLLGDESGSARSQIISQLAFLPGPLEGTYIPQLEVPPEPTKALQEAMGRAELDEGVLAPFVNMALVFRMEAEHAHLIAEALKKAKYQVNIGSDSEKIFSLLVGLSCIAAVTRSTELAADVRILARVLRRRAGVKLQADSLMRIGMIASAAEPESDKWAQIVGDWLTEVSFEEIDRENAMGMRSHVLMLCQLAPQLWKTCAKAEAALLAVGAMAV